MIVFVVLKVVDLVDWLGVEEGCGVVLVGSVLEVLEAGPVVVWVVVVVEGEDDERRVVVEEVVVEEVVVVVCVVLIVVLVD